MLSSSLFVTSGVAALAVATKLVDTHVPTGAAVLEVVRQGVYWEDVASRDEDRVLQLQHYAMALSLLHTARTMRPDHELERAVGFNVSRAVRSIEGKLTRLRQSVGGRERDEEPQGMGVKGKEQR